MKNHNVATTLPMSKDFEKGLFHSLQVLIARATRRTKSSTPATATCDDFLLPYVIYFSCVVHSFTYPPGTRAGLAQLGTSPYQRSPWQWRQYPKERPRRPDRWGWQLCRQATHSKSSRIQNFPFSIQMWYGVVFKLEISRRVDLPTRVEMLKTRICFRNWACTHGVIGRSHSEKEGGKVYVTI